jgi:hypothetical protein
VGDYYNYYRKTYDKTLSRKLYSEITQAFNEGISNLIIEEGLTYTFPKLNFELMTKKAKRKPYIKNGKLVNSVPPDWKRTKELWARNEEAKEKKIVVRYNNAHSSGYVFRLFCSKANSKMRNKSLFKFKTSRKFQRTLSARILDPDKDNFDSYLLY